MVSNGAILRAIVGFAIGSKSPMLAGFTLGITTTGPVMGGLFALSQGPALVSGGIMATIQSLVMGGNSTKTRMLGGVVGATIGVMAGKAVK